MKTAEQILQKVYDEHNPVTNVMDNEEWEKVCMKAMEEYANQFKKELDVIEKQKYHLRKEYEALLEDSYKAGIRKNPVIIDNSKNA